MNRKAAVVLLAAWLGLAHAWAGDVTTDNLTVFSNATVYGKCEILVGECPTNGLALSYSFATNTNLVPDLSGNGNTGIVSGATWTSAGKTNGAYTFDGADDYISANDAAALDLTSALTILAWIKTDGAVANWGFFVTKQPSTGGDNHAGNYSFGFDSSGILVFGSQFGSYNTENVSGSNEVDDAEWHLVGVTIDSSSKSVVFYIDGVVDASATAAQTPMQMANDEPVRIGQRKDGYYFDGTIDEVMIFNRVLSAAEVMYAYASYTPLSNPKLHVGGDMKVEGNIELNNNWLSGDGDEEGVFVDSTGRVGIGTNAPSERLEVAGNIQASGTGTFASVVGNGSGLTSLNGGYLQATSVTSSALSLGAVTTDRLATNAVTGDKIQDNTISTSDLKLAEVDARYVLKAGDTMGGTLKLVTNGLVVGGTQVVVTNGNVGIGTNTPGASLHVNGGVLIESNLTAKGQIVQYVGALGMQSFSSDPGQVSLGWNNGTRSNSYYGSIILGATYSNSLQAIMGSSAGSFIIGFNNSGGTQILSGASGSGIVGFNGGRQWVQSNGGGVYGYNSSAGAETNAGDGAEIHGYNTGVECGTGSGSEIHGYNLGGYRNVGGYGAMILGYNRGTQSATNSTNACLIFGHLVNTSDYQYVTGAGSAAFGCNNSNVYDFSYVFGYGIDSRETNSVSARRYWESGQPLDQKYAKMSGFAAQGDIPMGSYTNQP